MWDLVQIAGYVAARKKYFPRVLWRETVPQHFETPLGYWGGNFDGPWTCRPLNFGIDQSGALYLNKSPGKGNEAEGNEAERKKRSFYNSLDSAEGLDRMLRGGHQNIEARRVFEPAGIPVLGGWNDTMMLWDMHRNNSEGMECSHYCQPSAPQIWIYYLYVALRDSEL